MDREAWHAVVHGVAKSETWFGNWTTTWIFKLILLPTHAPQSSLQHYLQYLGHVKVLHSICQQIWKTQQWPQDWKRSVFIPIPKKGNPKECSNYCTIALISHTNKWSEVTHFCPTLCKPMDCSPPGSVHGIFQARILEWVAICFSRGSAQPRDWIGKWILYFWATREAQPGGKKKEWMRVQKKTFKAVKDKEQSKIGGDKHGN